MENTIKKVVRCTINLPLEKVIELDKLREQDNLTRSAWIANAVSSVLEQKNNINVELKAIKEELIELKEAVNKK